jgi:serine/threonine protein kinase
LFVYSVHLVPLVFSGKVYRGMLANGWPVAVKHIVKNEHAETFLREVTSLSHIRHPNLVSLRGYCDGQEECFLVYELCINSNLSEWLFSEYLLKEINNRIALKLYYFHCFKELHNFNCRKGEKPFMDSEALHSTW